MGATGMRSQRTMYGGTRNTSRVATLLLLLLLLLLARLLPRLLLPLLSELLLRFNFCVMRCVSASSVRALGDAGRWFRDGRLRKQRAAGRE